MIEKTVLGAFLGMPQIRVSSYIPAGTVWAVDLGQLNVGWLAGQYSAVMDVRPWAIREAERIFRECRRDIARTCPRIAPIEWDPEWPHIAYFGSAEDAKMFV